MEHEDFERDCGTLRTHRLFHQTFVTYPLLPAFLSQRDHEIFDLCRCRMELHLLHPLLFLVYLSVPHDKLEGSPMPSSVEDFLRGCLRNQRC